MYSVSQPLATTEYNYNIEQTHVRRTFWKTQNSFASLSSSKVCSAESLAGCLRLTRGKGFGLFTLAAAAVVVAAFWSQVVAVRAVD